MARYKSLSVDVLGKTLHELGIWVDNEDEDEPEYKSHLVTTCLRLRHVALGEYTVEDLRIMIGQNIGLECLVPLALDLLEVDPWVSGDLYAGDLLGKVLGCDRDFWATNRMLVPRINAVVEQAIRIRTRAGRRNAHLYDAV